MKILLIHGMWATAVVWEKYQQFLEDKGYDVDAVTLLYHGGPPGRLENIGVFDYIRQIKDKIKVLPTKPIIIGHSMGGLIAQKLAEMGLAEKLVLIAPSAPRGILAMEPSVFRTFSANILDVFCKVPFIIPYGNTVYGIMNTMSCKQRIKAYRDFVFESGLAAYEILMGKVDVDSNKVTCPTLVIAGSRDRVTPPRMVRRVSNKYKARYVEYYKHCHYSLVRSTGWKRVAADIVRWIRGGGE